MFAPLWPYGYPARFATSGGCATRSAQTVLAEFPESAALLGHTGRQSDSGEEDSIAP